MKTTITLLTALLVLSGCAATGQPPKYNPHHNESYVVRGHNRTFALYNNGHRLISHPVEDLLAEMKLRRLTDKYPITDIYVISHGWNYTLPVAVANYHTYIQLADDFYSRNRQAINDACNVRKDLEDKHRNALGDTNSDDPAEKAKADKCWQPYFIFISWTSTVRPLTDATNAVLPFGMDAAVRPLSSFVDKVPAHILTAWKQSLNAGQNALGSKFPNDYLNTDWKDLDYGFVDRSVIEDSDSHMGEDIPVSALLYKLIQIKSNHPEKDSFVYTKRDKEKPESCDKPDPINPASDVCISLDNTKLHLAGHSYGAKLVSLAGMEAIRRWLLEGLDTPENPDTFKKALKDFNDPLWKDTGHKFIGEEMVSTDWPSKQDPKTLRAAYNANPRSEQMPNLPIDSLILFNPAFLPGELSYPVELFKTAPLRNPKIHPKKSHHLYQF